MEASRPPPVVIETDGGVGLLYLWHTYRFHLLAFVILFWLAALRYRTWRSHKAKITSSPITVPYHVSNSEKIWHEEEHRDVSISKQVTELSNERTINDKQSNNSAPRAGHLSGPKRVTGSKLEKKANLQSIGPTKIQPLVFYFSLTGTTDSYARDLFKDLEKNLDEKNSTVLAPIIHDLSYIDYDNFFISPPKSNDTEKPVQFFYLLLIPSYNIDTALDSFLGHLQETHHDFRIDTSPLSPLAGYSVFGFGDREGWPTEAEGFCSQAVDVDKWMAKLTGKKRAFPLGMGDGRSDAPTRLEEWKSGVIKILLEMELDGGLGEGILGSGNAYESDEEEIAEVKVTSSSNPQKAGERKRSQNASKVDDLEDLGSKARATHEQNSEVFQSPSPLPIDFTTTTVSNSPTTTQTPKAMVPISSPTHAALTKQGYTIIGTHSGVKICRWTKSALRGRGSCYKNSFYGIKSHLCMETTPSLSCSNKCVFCWRHGTNPVSTTWRWQVDPPELIFEGAKAGHYKKIKMMRGVPGVRAERFQEAMQIRHCALSLVGEPIFYPHINVFTSLLHKERISSFLVCNAQHPDQLEALKPVTQLYISIDASNADSLRKIDRPLHRDYWQRFLRCLDILGAKRLTMRTVFRLTLVKGFNIESEVEGYADLVTRGLPCFVEIKGVTYCGTSSSTGAGLTMQNVPFYQEIVEFVEALDKALASRGLEYGIAAEHQHSCCVLIASKRFLVKERWHTLIDYERFFECLDSGEDFAPEDYMGPPTPEWATWGRGGFDPADERVDRKGRPVALTKATAE